MLPRSTRTRLRRNNASPPTGTAALPDLTRALETPTTFGAIPSSATATNSASASVSSNDGNSGWPSYGSDSDSTFQSSWVTWLAVIIVIGVVCALFASRFFYIRKVYHTASPRAFFVPQKGIHVNFLRIHIAGAPARSPSVVNSTPYSISGAPTARRRRRRRHRQTVGETLGAGGTRLGVRDEDDGWDDDGADEDDGDEEEEVGMTEEHRRGRGTARRRADEDLPQYFADSGLPAYAPGPATAAPFPPPLAARDARSALPGATASAGEVDVLPSAAEYEAFSRGGRDGDPPSSLLPVTALSPTYPPPAHLHNSIPSDPPPSFYRSASMVRSSSDFEEEEGRRHSMGTASSSATKLDGKEEAEATKMGAASGSVASGAGEKNAEEKGDKEGR
ncbi:hypothetical protein JCM1841_006105 [Sporobolomyces salmonicolor]